MPPIRSRHLALTCLLLAGCTGSTTRLGVSALPGAPAIAPRAPQAAGPSAIAPIALEGRVFGPAAGLIANNSAGLIGNNAAGLIANNSAGIVSTGSASYRVLTPASTTPVGGARVSLVDAQGRPIGDEAVTTGPDGRYAFAHVSASQGLVFVRATFERDGKALSLLAPTRLGSGRATDASPATTLVAKTLIRAIASGKADPETVDAAALEALADLLAPVMSDRAIALALLAPDDQASTLIGAMAAQSPSLAAAIAKAPAPGGGFVPAPPPTSSSNHHAPIPTIATLYAASAVPAGVGTGAPLEYGVKFRAKRDGTVTALRFYKDASDVGPHVVNLWTLDGRLLASATSTAESASGWQEVALPTPVALRANVTYVASCFAASGVYSYDDHAFTASGIDGAILQAPAATVVEGNGVFAMSGASTFPASPSLSDAQYAVDVVFSSFDPAAEPGATSLFGDAAPETGPVLDATANELGVKFRSDVAGWATGVRFYKGAGNTGAHLGTLWAADGTRLAGASFSAETGSGWQTVTFPYPVAIAPATTYVASYRAPMGHYMADQYYFHGLSHKRGALEALADGADGANSVYKAGGDMGFPTLTNGRQTNYWVDVTFSTTAPAAPASVSFWNEAAAPADDQVDPGDPLPYELGVTFTAKVAGAVTGVRFYKGPANTGTHVASLWDPSGSLMASATYTSETASGWQTVSFASPVTVMANQSYVVSYSCPNGHTSATHGFFDTGMANDYMRVPVAGGVYSTTPGEYPGTVFSNNNYWVEPLFAPAP